MGDRFNFNLKLFLSLFSSLINHQEDSFSKLSDGPVKNFHFLKYARKCQLFVFFFETSKFAWGNHIHIPYLLLYKSQQIFDLRFFFFSFFSQKINFRSFQSFCTKNSPNLFFNVFPLKIDPTCFSIFLH